VSNDYAAHGSSASVVEVTKAQLTLNPNHSYVTTTLQLTNFVLKLLDTAL
jgi:hypothetical protein